MYWIPCAGCLGFWTQWNKLWTLGALRTKRVKPITVCMVRTLPEPIQASHIDAPQCIILTVILFYTVLDEISEEHRKQSCNQSRSYKTSSLKPFQPHCQSQQKRCVYNSLLDERTNMVNHPLSFAGLSSASRAPVFSHFSAPMDRSHLVGAARTDGLGHSGTKKKDTSGKNKEMKRKTIFLVGDSETKCDQAVKTKSSHGTENFKQIAIAQSERKCKKLKKGMQWKTQSSLICCETNLPSWEFLQDCWGGLLEPSDMQVVSY